MKNRVITLALFAMLLALGSSAQAQQPKKVFRIGYLSAGDPGTESARSEAFRVALRERGYIEGQNISIEYRYAKGKIERLPQLAAQQEPIP
jgi:putative ABC transport system substrate-binding protein